MKGGLRGSQGGVGPAETLGGEDNARIELVELFENLFNAGVEEHVVRVGEHEHHLAVVLVLFQLPPEDEHLLAAADRVGHVAALPLLAHAQHLDRQPVQLHRPHVALEAARLLRRHRQHQKFTVACCQTNEKAIKSSHRSLAILDRKENDKET